MKCARVPGDPENGPDPTHKKIGGTENQQPRQARAIPAISAAAARDASVESTESNPVSSSALDESKITDETGKGQAFTQSVLQSDNSQVDREVRMRQLAGVFIEMFRTSRKDVPEVLNQKVA